MIESVCTKDGVYNVNEVYEVTKETAMEWIKLSYAIMVCGRESTSISPATRTATKNKVSKR